MAMKRDKANRLRELIVLAAVSLPDEEALEGVELFERWRVGIECAAGKRYQYNGELYRCKQTHTAQTDWTPDVAVSLFEKVAPPGEGDTPDRPIAYNGNMALESGKYYTQNGVVYRCTRDTINPVYVDLSALVGLYVEVVA